MSFIRSGGAGLWALAVVACTSTPPVPPAPAGGDLRAANSDGGGQPGDRMGDRAGGGDVATGDDRLGDLDNSADGAGDSGGGGDLALSGDAPSGSDSAGDQAPSAQLLLYSTLDDLASITSPAVGTGLGAALNGGTFTPGMVGNALSITVKGDFATFSQAAGGAQNIELSRGTVDFWYRPGYDHDDGLEYMFYQSARRVGFPMVTNLTPGALELGKHNVANFNSLMMIYWEPAMAPLPTRYESTVQPPNYAWTAGTWVHIRMTWDWTVPPGTQNVRVYMGEPWVELPVIGRDPGDPPHTGPKIVPAECVFVAGTSPCAAERIYIGGQPLDGGGGWQVNGLVDELRIYDRPMPP